MIYLKVTEIILIQMEICTKVIYRKVKKMDKGNTFMQMVMFFKVID